jgi:hypothetical protein
VPFCIEQAMTEELVKQNRTLEWFGVVASAGALAYVQWILNRNSVEEPHISILIRNILVDFTCFSITLIIGIKFTSSLMIRFLRSLLMGLIGAIISTSLIDLPFFYQDMPNWRGDSTGWLLQATIFMLVNCLIVGLAVTLVFAAGFIVKIAVNLPTAPNSAWSGLAGE